MNRSVLVAVSVALLASGAAARAESPFTGAAPEARVEIGAPPQDTYGTGSLTVYSIPAPNFTGIFSTVTYNSTAGLTRTITGGGPMVASPMLPNGSQIEQIELSACDSDAASEVVFQFGPCPGPGGSSCVLAGEVRSGVAATPGCGEFLFTLPTPVVVNNQTEPIIAVVTTGVNSFGAAKFYYRLRVSPAPASATFPNDVPTSHPFFRFIEALAAAGITGGCGAGSFCPNAPVTRGEIAVFLSVALGLHFPN